jgi:hypothetical protein
MAPSLGFASVLKVRPFFFFPSITSCHCCAGDGKLDIKDWFEIVPLSASCGYNLAGGNYSLLVQYPLCICHVNALFINCVVLRCERFNYRWSEAPWLRFMLPFCEFGADERRSYALFIEQTVSTLYLAICLIVLSLLLGRP